MVLMYCLKFDFLLLKKDRTLERYIRRCQNGEESEFNMKNNDVMNTFMKEMVDFKIVSVKQSHYVNCQQSNSQSLLSL